MPEDFTNWQKSQPNPPRKPLDLRWRASHASNQKPKVNPHRQEAERDRVVFRWVLGVVLLLIAFGVIIWIVASQTPEKQ
jgi:cytoskeletal protein RodZ